MEIPTAAESRAPVAEGMYAAAFEARHDCVVGNISRDLPGLRILQWCLENRDIFQVTGTTEEIESFHERISELTPIVHNSRTSDGSLLVTRRCACSPLPRHSISDAIEEAHAWDIPPIVYREGWESWRVIAWNEASIRKLFTEIRTRGEVRITSLRPIENPQMEQMMLMPAADVFAGLTDRQTDALLLGLENGYYSLPSETEVWRLAQGIGVAPSTFAEHLRKAETHILRNLRPYLQAYNSRAPGEAVVAEMRPVSRRIARARRDRRGT